MSQVTALTIALDRAPSRNRTFATATAVVLGSLLIWASALVQVPVPGTPVPMTLQTFAVLMLGLTLGPRAGAGAAALYFLESMAAPGVFMASGRFALTGGYILGFVPAAFIAGVLFQKGWGRGWLRALPAMIAAKAVVLLCGAAWMAISLMSFADAVKVALAPFLGIEVFKIVLAVALMKSTSALSKRFEGSTD